MTQLDVQEIVKLKRNQQDNFETLYSLNTTLHPYQPSNHTHISQWTPSAAATSTSPRCQTPKSKTFNNSSSTRHKRRASNNVRTCIPLPSLVSLFSSSPEVVESMRHFADQSHSNPLPHRRLLPQVHHRQDFRRQAGQKRRALHAKLR